MVDNANKTTRDKGNQAKEEWLNKKGIKNEF